MMTTIPTRTASDARSHFSDVLDEAQNGTTPVIERRNQAFVVADRQRFVEALRPALPIPSAVPEDGGWSLMLDGYPIAADGVLFADALDDFISALHEYAQAWGPRLRHASNHASNWPLVQFIQLTDDETLRDWILAVDE